MKIRMSLFFASVSTFLLADIFSSAQVSIKSLEKNFSDPPRESRPMVWWHWMNGNITKDGIKKDLEWMDRAGIRGFHHFDAALQTPQVVDNRLVYMTPAWKDAFRYALDIADSLDLEVGIASSPGWSHSGGPWVEKKDAMKKVVWREISVKGGEHFEGALPEPFSVPGPFQNSGSIEYLGVKSSDSNLYQDIAVVALRLPDKDRELTPSSVRTSGSEASFASLSDYDLSTGATVKATEDGCWIEYSFDHPVTVRSLVIADDAAHGPISFKADGKEILNFPLSGVSQQTFDFEPVTAKTFRLDVTLIPKSPILELLGIKPSEGEVNITEFRLSEVSRVNRAEAKAAFTNLENLADYPTLADGVEHPSKVIDLTNNYKDGILRWNAPKGNWKVFRFGWSLTGKMNAPAPVEATGLEVDKLDPEAIKSYYDHYLSIYKDALGGSLAKIDYILNDSWEAGNSNWTPSLREEFRMRRGYDLIDWLPAIAGYVVGSVDQTEKFLLDYRETLEELMAENFDRLTDILHSYGLKGRYSESHEGSRAFTADGMDIKRRADIPMSAMWVPGSILGSPAATSIADIRESASVSHIYGQKFVAAESMTSTGLYGKAYSFYPGNLKPVADLEFASGANRIIIHESAHQPLDDYFPGVGLNMTGQWFNRHETWAEIARPWTDYLSRSSYLLQQGNNVADYLVYYGEDTNITAKYSSGQITLPKGSNYDFVNPYALVNVIDYMDGVFMAPSGNTWKALVIDTDKLSEEIRGKIDEWKKKGATILSPDEASSYALPLDVQTDADIRFVHRRISDAEIYWISKPSNSRESIHLSFNSTGEPSVWDPETGEISPVSFSRNGSSTEVDLVMENEDAKFIVFDKNSSLLSREVPKTSSSQLLILDGPWNVSFQKGRGVDKENATFDQLIPYTASKDSSIQHFSGTAVYSKHFTMPHVDGKVVLDLGDVEKIAEVFVNSVPVRTLWKSPYSVEITDYLKEGDNVLEVRVTNLWQNRLIYDATLPENQKLTHTTYPFFNGTEKLSDDGLLGPVRLLSVF